MADDGSNKLIKITDPPPDNKQIAAAHHEAGHVVVGIRLGFSLVSVRLAQPGENWQGRTEFECWLDDEDSNVIMIEAGPIAGYVFDPDSGEAAAYDGRDKQMIKERWPKRSRDVLRAQAAQCVGNNWHLIKRVAQDLLDAEELSGEQVRALITT
jgi:hypothetical protein